MDNRKVFAEMMRAAREEQGVTYKELAEVACISEVYCREIERGIRMPTWIIWLKICTYLNIDIGELCDVCIKPELNIVGEMFGLTF